ncbi:S8 family peptidase [Algiphilus sp.]|uniref:S8 family peptidase n=1 Tax=Algiphilus sp. TaxID=1872431 RepID=UPI003B527B84
MARSLILRLQQAAITLLLAGLLGCTSEPPDIEQSSTAGDGAASAERTRYILLFDPEVVQIRRSTVRDENGEVVELIRFVNDLILNDLGELLLGPFEAINGILIEVLGSLTPSSFADQPGLRVVEEDRLIRLPFLPGNGPDLQATPWGLDRIDQRERPLDGRYIPEGDGAGIHLYIVDTGINASHVDFLNRVREGQNIREPDAPPDDCNGHGTHVAGTAAGTRYGVAPLALLHPVRIFDCEGEGRVSDVLAGMDWVLRNHEAPAIMNLSISGDRSTAIESAAATAQRAGLVVVTAAGNGGDDACTVSPAASAAAMTVGATTREDRRAAFSNPGRCVDLMAPGNDIVSARHDTDTGAALLSGTSMAAAHVTGAAALILGQDPTADPETVRRRLLEDATPDTLSVGEGSPNRLLFVGLE